MTAIVGPRAAWRSTLIGELGAEFIGTFVLIAFGDGVVAMAVAALNQSGRGTEIFAASGDWLLITWGWAFAVTFGVYVAGGVTGAHINPAVTFAQAVKRGFPWSKVPAYWLAQALGAFVGAALVWMVYHDAISSYEAANNVVRGTLGGPHDSTVTFSIFATFPAPYFSGGNIGPLIDQIVGTGFLVMFILALTDERNQPPTANLAPLIVGFVVAAIGMSFGANAGYAINPARDFGPRSFAWLIGYGDVAYPGIHDYWWVPIAGPLIGALVAPFLYDFFIRDVLYARAEPPTPFVEARGRTVEAGEEQAEDVPSRDADSVEATPGSRRTEGYRPTDED